MINFNDIFHQILILLARAINIYPLSWILNYFRDTKITKRMQFIMWFSGELIIQRIKSWFPLLLELLVWNKVTFILISFVRIAGRYLLRIKLASRAWHWRKKTRHHYNITYHCTFHSSLSWRIHIFCCQGNVAIINFYPRTIFIHKFCL